MEALGQYGAIGAICALAIANIYYLQRVLVTVIENNTKALAHVEKVVEQCQAKGNAKL